MIKELIFRLRFLFSCLNFNNQKEQTEKLKKSFGKLKEDSFDFNSIEKYFRNKDNAGAYQILSDKTCNDLDFDELFMFLDRTNSTVGQQYLYNTLRAIKADKHQTKLNEVIIT